MKEKERKEGKTEKVSGMPEGDAVQRKHVRQARRSKVNIIHLMV